MTQKLSYFNVDVAALTETHFADKGELVYINVISVYAPMLNKSDIIMEQFYE